MLTKRYLPIEQLVYPIGITHLVRMQEFLEILCAQYVNNCIDPIKANQCLDLFIHSSIQ